MADEAQLKRAIELFHALVDLPQTEQAGRVHSACAGDEPLRELVTQLLAADRAATGPLEHVRIELVRAATAWHPLQRDLSGTVLDGYRVLEQVGAGGMGVVYAAERIAVGGRVAIKVLREPALRDRFLMEQRMHAQLVHPGIPQFHGAGTTPDGAPYFVLEFVAGLPLTDYCAKHASALGERLRLFREVCEAVLYAHQRALIHRDLKPGNILVCAAGAVRLLDFGIAKRLAEFDEPAFQTQTAARCFTPAYAAPEQHRGDAVDVSADVYALGVLLYELLALRHPFELAGCDQLEIARRVCETDPERLSLAARASTAEHVLGPVSRGAWADLNRVTAKAMEKRPEARYRSVEALIRDLDHFHAGRPLEARPDTWAYRTTKFVSRHRRRIALASAVATLLLGLTTVYVVGMAHARDEAAAEAARAARVQSFMRSLMAGHEDAVSPKQALQVETVLDRAVAEARGLGHDRALQAEVHSTVGSLYTALGKLDRAAPLLKSALESDRGVFGWNSAAVARDLLAWSALRMQQGKHAEAERAARQALEVGSRAKPNDFGFRAEAASQLGDVYNEQGRFQEAITQLSGLVKQLQERGAKDDDLNSLFGTLANAHYYFGNYAESERLNRLCLELDRRKLGEGHPKLSDTLINLGAIAGDQGHFAEAEQLNREALGVFEAWHGPDHPETASARTIWARSLNNLQRYSEAEPALQQAIATYRRVYPEVHPRIASALNELGLVARLQGKLAEAETHAAGMLRIERALHQDKHHRVGIALANLASVYMEQKRYAEAEPMFREALSIYANTLAKDHLNVAVARFKLGRCLKLQTRYAEAVIETEAAYAMLRTQQTPIRKWLDPTAEDLIALREALGEPERAAAIRAELAAR
jgi:serine/threonine-protein kinase